MIRTCFLKIICFNVIIIIIISLIFSQYLQRRSINLLHLFLTPKNQVRDL